MDGSYASNGGLCLIKWTNSFVQISSILERNAREHDASLVMFTGDVRAEGDAAEVIYSKVKSSPYNFRICAMEGVDSEKDGIPPNAVNVHKHGEFPPSFVLGDSETRR